MELTAGVLDKPKRLFVTSSDVMKLLGCKSSYAGKVLKEINDEAKESGMHAFPSGKANKYIFAEKFGIPLDDIDRAMSE